MAKKNRIYEYDDDEELVLDKKTKRRLERARQKESQLQRQQQQAQKSKEVEPVEEDLGSDVMSQIALSCQQNRWIEAVLACRKALREAQSAQSEDREDASVPLSMALEKLEMSQRRQRAAIFISSAKELLKKEYLLDVGE